MTLTPDNEPENEPQPLLAQTVRSGINRRDLLKVGAAGMLGGWELLAASARARAAETKPFGAQSSPVPLLFDEPPDRPPGRLRWPVTVGLPMANGALDSLDGLALFAGDEAAPAQFAEALRWRFGQKSISWVHCDLQTEFGDKESPAAELRAGQRNPPPVAAVKVSDEGTHFQVDTGAVTFTCHKTAFSLFDSFTADGQPLVKSSSLYWKDAQGNVYESSRAPCETTVEMSGPMRAVIRYDGWYESAAGSRKLRYSLWLHAFAGLPYVRMYDKLIWTENLTLYISIDTASGTLTTKSLFADRISSDTRIAHGWATGDAVKWSYSHSDRDEFGAGQQYDNTSERGRATVTLPRIAGAPLDRDTPYYVRATGEYTLTLHRTEADARAGANPLQFLDVGNFTSEGKTYVGRHYLEAQQPVLAEWGMRFEMAEPVRHAHVDVVGAPRPAGYDFPPTKSVTAYQKEYGTAILTADGRDVRTGHLAGWAEARFDSGAGFAAAIKGLAQQIPKVVDVDGSSLTVKLWGGSPMSLRENNRVLPEFLEIDRQKEWLAMSGEPNPVGLSKLHEIWFWPSHSIAENRLINDLVQRPVACCADPTHACASDYLQGVSSAQETPAAWGYVEEALENTLRYVVRRDPAQADYDEWNFGDLRLYQNGPFRTWDNGGYNCSDLFWRQYYRTGKRFFLEEGIHNARHMMDVDTIAHSQTSSVGVDTYMRIAGRTHNYATLHWAWPASYGDNFVDHPAYLLLCWLMTGYEPARTVLETKCAERKRSGYGNPGDLKRYNLAITTREQYGAAPPKFVYYELTGDPQFYEAGRKWLQLALDTQAASVEKNGHGTHLFPNNNFWGFFYEAFRYSYRHDGDSAVRAGLAQTVDDFAEMPRNDYDAPTFACTWPLPSRLDRARLSLLPFVTAYQHTGEISYLQYAAERIARQARTVQSSGVLNGYDSLETTIKPLFVRDAISVLGAWREAGHRQVSWPGNLPLFGSWPIAAAPWMSQLTFWAKKEAGVAGNLRLLFKDSNPTNFEAPGKFRAVIVNEAGQARQIILSTDVAHPVVVDGSRVTPAGVTRFVTGEPVHFKTTGTLPRELAPDTTYYVHVLVRMASPTWTIHQTFSDAMAGANPLDLSGGSGALSIEVADVLREAVITLPPTDPAGTYRIHVQGEAPAFSLAPMADTQGLVVEMHGMNDLRLNTCFGPAEYYFRMRRGFTKLKLSAPTHSNDKSLPVVVLDEQRRELGGLDFRGEEETANEVDVPAQAAAGTLTLAKGYMDFAPRHLEQLPTVRLGGAERYVAVSPAQWFNPLASFNREIAAYWSFDEAAGTRHDATGHGRDLAENHGPIGNDSASRLGYAAEFARPGNSFLSSQDPVFRADESFTVWGWARLTDFAGTRYLFVKGGDVAAVPTSCEWAIYTQAKQGPQIFMQARSGKRFAFTAGVPLASDGAPHFIIAWYDARARNIFLQVDAGEPVSQALGGPINVGDGSFCVGGCGPNGRGWIGQIAAVGFAKSVLTPTERRMLHNGGSGHHFPF